MKNNHYHILGFLKSTSKIVSAPSIGRSPHDALRHMLVTTRDISPDDFHVVDIISGQPV